MPKPRLAKYAQKKPLRLLVAGSVAHRIQLLAMPAGQCLLMKRSLFLTKGSKLCEEAH